MCNSPPAAFGEFHVHSVYQIEKRIYSLFPPFVKHFDDDRLNFLFIKKKKKQNGMSVKFIAMCRTQDKNPLSNALKKGYITVPVFFTSTTML